jgi:cation:H+ antiporter
VPEEWEPEAEQARPPAGGGWFADLGMVAAGVVMLVVGAHLMVDAATRVAAAVGVSDLVIGLTVVSIGTSLPEVATAVIAALRGERELAIGNVVGSCVCNIGLVMGVTAVVARAGVPVDLAAVRLDMPVMVAVAAGLLPVVFTGFVITRVEAAMFLAYYVVYVAYLLLDAADHDALPAFSATLLWFVIPITVVTWTLLSLHQFRVRRSYRLSKGK